MQTPPTPPTAPQAPVATPVTTSGAATGVQTQTTTLTYDQLRARGSELSRQLNSATSRRDGLLRDIRRASPDAKPGLQLQFNTLSSRVAQIEQDIAINGQLMAQAKGLEASAPGEAVTSVNGGPPWAPQVSRIDGTAIGVCLTLFVLCPIALAVARNIWKRGTRLSQAPVASSREADLRMERVEQAVDAIAVEVERISEGQRFVTQLMTQMPALGEGAAQPVNVPVAERVMAEYPSR